LTVAFLRRIGVAAALLSLAACAPMQAIDPEMIASARETRPAAQAQAQALPDSAPQLLVAEAPPAEASVEGELVHERGLASWYGRRFHGRRTASGERFDMHAFTAAHPNLPFGSWIRVRNTADGRSVDVRVNDRGPHVKQRVIDLSRAAAQALGLVQSGAGTEPVTITVLRR
jgi:rare lipoprotein A